MAELKRTYILPQEGTDCTAEGESLTDNMSVCPAYSGGGEVRSPKSTAEETGKKEENTKMEENQKKESEKHEDQKQVNKKEENKLEDPFARKGLQRTPPTGCSKKLVQQAFHPGLFITRPRSGSVGSVPPSTPGDKSDTDATTDSRDNVSPRLTKKNPFSRGGAVQRSPPDGIGNRDENLCAVQTEEDPQLHSGKSRMLQLHGARERRCSLGSMESYNNDSVRKSQAAKRVRMEEDEKDGRQDEIMRVIARLTKVTAGLVKIVSGDENIKQEIKTGVQDLRKEIDQLNKTTNDWEWKATLHKSKTRAIMKSSAERGTQTENDNINNTKNVTTQTETDSDNRNDIVNGVDVATQTTEPTNEMSMQVDIGNEAITWSRDVLTNKLSEGLDLNDLVQIIELEWPEEVFKAVKMQKGNPLTLDRNWDLVVLAKPRKEKNENMKGIRKLLEKGYPEAIELLDEGEAGRVEFAVRTIRSSKSGVGEGERYTYVLPCHITLKDKEDTEKLYRQLEDLKQVSDDHNKNKNLAIIIEAGIDKGKVRKIIEAIWTNDIRKIHILVEGHEMLKKKGNVKAKNMNIETITIRGEGSYADILRKAKSGVKASDIKDLGVIVKSVKKVGGNSGESQMTMKVKANTQQVEAFKERLAGVFQGEKVVIGLGGETTFHIAGIEEETTSEEIKEAVEAQLRVPVRVGSLRPTQYRGKNATISIGNTHAKKMPNLTWVNIGWTRCRMRKRVNIKKCYKCWATGHIATNCQGPDRSELCLRCGRKGHKAGNCSNNMYCPICSEPGHRAVSTGCPEFRKAIRDSRLYQPP